MQMELNLDDSQLVRHATTGSTGRLDHIKGNLAFVSVPDKDWLEMWSVANTMPAEHLFIWPRYFGGNEWQTNSKIK